MSSDPTVPFEAVLRRIHPRDDVEERASARVSPWYVPAFRESAGPSADAAPPGPRRDAYMDGDPPEPGPAGVARSIAADDILAELDLAGCADIAALLARRRQFARTDHPDSRPAGLRENATTRMMIANGLIDAEIVRRRSA